MTQTTQAYSPATDIKENSFNLRYKIGDTVHFILTKSEKNFNGIILKKYTNSCLLDITENSLTLDEARNYKGKIVISYKDLILTK